MSVVKFGWKNVSFYNILQWSNAWQEIDWGLDNWLIFEAYVRAAFCKKAPLHSKFSKHFFCNYFLSKCVLKMKNGFVNRAGWLFFIWEDWNTLLFGSSTHCRDMKAWTTDSIWLMTYAYLDSQRCACKFITVGAKKICLACPGGCFKIRFSHHIGPNSWGNVIVLKSGFLPTKFCIFGRLVNVLT